MGETSERNPENPLEGDVDETKCAQCGKVLDEEGKTACVASMSGSVMGDETTEAYYFCSDCGVYTKTIYHDSFSGEGSFSVSDPIPKADGDAKVALIKRCSMPWNKSCRCDAHKEYFEGWLD